MDKIHSDLTHGVLTEVHTSELDGKMYVTHKADIQPHIEYATALRNSDEYTRQGIKRGWMHAAHIDPVTIVELKGIGIDVYTAPAKEIIAGLKRINKDGLLTTRARV